MDHYPSNFHPRSQIEILRFSCYRCVRSRDVVRAAGLPKCLSSILGPIPPSLTKQLANKCLARSAESIPPPASCAVGWLRVIDSAVAVSKPLSTGPVSWGYEDCLATVTGFPAQNHPGCMRYSGPSRAMRKWQGNPICRFHAPLRLAGSGG
jgi:hypothetical protein